MNPFQKASRSQVFLKLAITGPTGSGKTFSALRLAKGLIEESGKRIAFLDTENDSASLYSDNFDFDVMPIAPPFPAESFASGVDAAVAAGYGAIVIDSASHLWKGVLAYKSQLDERGGNQYTNWKDPDKKFQLALDAVLQSKIHAIFCMRSKMEYIIEENARGKQAPKKVGLAPIMKDGIEFEFTTVFDVAMNHEAGISKDRSGLYPIDKFFTITEDTGKQLDAWLKTATPKPEPVAPATVELTEEEAHAKNVDALRKVIVKNCNNEDAENYEALFCGKAAALCEDNRDRMKLEQFTLSELRGPVWKVRAAVLSMIHATTGNGKA